MSQVALLFWCHAVMLPVAIIVALGTGGPGSHAVLLVAWVASLITIVGYLFGFALQMLASRAAPPPVIGLVFCLEPVVAIIGAGIVLGETLSVSHMIGGGLVLAALVTSSLMDLKRAPQGQ
jgi:drug/metabolite transporter (DMT)-like permease